ncbi:MAG: aspartate 1-decarboxylase [Dongiaceae bacterium]
MLVSVLYSQINNATVTDTDANAEGGILIDSKLMDLANMSKYQKVTIYNMTNGARFDSFIMPAELGSQAIEMNGALAHNAKTGDKLMICAYAAIPSAAVANWEPTKVAVDGKNKPIHTPDAKAIAMLDKRRHSPKAKKAA